jgi:ATP synthase protein I
MLILAAQVGITIVSGAGLALLANPLLGYSALVGGLIGVLPNYYFAARLMRRRTSAVATQALRDVYLGEFVKIAFTAALFVIAIKLLDIDFIVVVSTYLVVAMVNWLAFVVASLAEAPHDAVQLQES